jgi:uncharacterized protein (DUF488 family)
MTRQAILTIGHSNHPIGRFVELLRANAVTAIADVRSSPFSRHNPQFTRDALQSALKGNGIAYLFLGNELGGRAPDKACYADGRIQYDRVARTAWFQAGIERVRAEAAQHRIALMCAEKEPLDCHRALLVARALERAGERVEHIHADGRVEAHADAMRRLLDLVGLPRADMFRSRQEQEDEAVRGRAGKVAYVDEGQSRGSA